MKYNEELSYFLAKHLTENYGEYYYKDERETYTSALQKLIQDFLDKRQDMCYNSSM